MSNLPRLAAPGPSAPGGSTDLPLQADHAFAAIREEQKTGRPSAGVCAAVVVCCWMTAPLPT